MKTCYCINGNVLIHHIWPLGACRDTWLLYWKAGCSLDNTGSCHDAQRQQMHWSCSKCWASSPKHWIIDLCDSLCESGSVTVTQQTSQKVVSVFLCGEIKDLGDTGVSRCTDAACRQAVIYWPFLQPLVLGLSPEFLTDWRSSSVSLSAEPPHFPSSPDGYSIATAAKRTTHEHVNVSHP